MMSDVLGKFAKRPDERKRYTIEYGEWLDSGELLTTVTFKVTPATDSPFVIDGYLIGESGTLVSFFASGGNDGETYDVVVTANTTGGQIKESRILFFVRT